MAKWTFIFSALVIMSISSCDGVYHGCTKCAAVNYEPRATSDNGSCLLVHGDLLGEYHAIDTVIGGPGLDTSHAEILVTLDQTSCDPDELSLFGILPSRYASEGLSFILQDDGEILVPTQYFEFEDEYLHTLYISEGTGSITNQYIEFSYYYSTTFDAYERRLRVELE